PGGVDVASSCCGAWMQSTCISRTPELQARRARRNSAVPARSRYSHAIGTEKPFAIPAVRGLVDRKAGLCSPCQLFLACFTAEAASKVNLSRNTPSPKRYLNNDG